MNLAVLFGILRAHAQIGKLRFCSGKKSCVLSRYFLWNTGVGIVNTILLKNLF